jgi:hypothetical protein
MLVDRGRALGIAVMSAALGAAYFAGAWILWAATPGQRALGLAVRGAGGTALAMAPALARWLFLIGPLALAPLIGFALPAWPAWLDAATFGWYVVLVASTLLGPRRRGLHDRLSGSCVIVARPARRSA